LPARPAFDPAFQTDVEAWSASAVKIWRPIAVRTFFESPGG
jgi:hypothetical protein